MKMFVLFLSIASITFYLTSCNQSPSKNEGTIDNQFTTDKELAEFISKIKAVDNHAHPNTIEPDDKGFDALPLDVIFPFEVPARIRPESQDWLTAYKSLYGYKGAELTENDIQQMQGTIEKTMKEKGEAFPNWVLDQCGLDVMLANRLTMGPGISTPRFRWVSFVDALLFPLSTKAEAAASPDREKLFALEDQHLKNFLAALNIPRMPATLDEYLKRVVTGTLEAQKSAGCIAVKFEVAFLRSLDFEKADALAAAKIYSHFVNGSEPTHSEYKLLQDYLFFYIAREAGQLALAVHIHAFPAPGNYFVAAGSDPILLEPVLNDPELRNTKFVLIHGGGSFIEHTNMMLWKPNIYADLSALTRLWTPSKLAAVLKDWLTQFPEKILFGTDAASFGPGLGWELNAWIATATGRQSLAIALSEMVRNNEISHKRAKEIATMVMRTNANNLYKLGLH